jgi:hypothetical protein
MTIKEEIALWDALNSLYEAGVDWQRLQKTAERVGLKGWPYWLV